MKQKLFTKAFFCQMLPLAVPIALQNLLSASFRLVDMLMIGRLGDTSIAAVGLAGQVSFLVELIAFGMASGSAVFMAQYHGANNNDGIRRAFGASALFLLPVGVICSVLVMLYPTLPMQILTDDAALIAEGARYLAAAAPSYAALTCSVLLMMTLRSVERVKLPMVATGISAAMNAVWNYALIFGKFGMPEMGVAGAGLATAISSWVAPVLMLAFSLRRGSILRAPLRVFFRLKGFGAMFWKRVTPVLCNEVAWSMSVVLLNICFGRMGADNFAGLTVFRTVENIVFVSFVGVCHACNILVGKHIGAGQIEEGKRIAKRFLYLCPLLGLSLGVLIVLFRGPILGLFDVSETAAHTANCLLMIYAAEVGVRNVPYIAVVGVFRGGGETRIGFIVDAITQYALVVPVVAVCGLLLKLPFVLTYVIMLVVDDFSKCCVYLPYFRSMRWIKPVAKPADCVEAEQQQLSAP